MNFDLDEKMNFDLDEKIDEFNKIKKLLKYHNLNLYNYKIKCDILGSKDLFNQFMEKAMNYGIVIDEYLEFAKCFKNIKECDEQIVEINKWCKLNNISLGYYVYPFKYITNYNHIYTKKILIQWKNSGIDFGEFMGWFK